MFIFICLFYKPNYETVNYGVACFYIQGAEKLRAGNITFVLYYFSYQLKH